ncbi:MAG: hypothetical protein ACXAC5_04320 [Promethearchaeota archaeon]|jgi:transcription elongation factor Elf1
MEVTCNKCKSICEVDGEYPKFFAWCDTCDDYADHDMMEFATEWYAGLIDYTYDMMRDREMFQNEKPKARK